MLNFKLYNGVELPCLGLGSHRAKVGDEAENAVKVALENGYRCIDTATYYQNEQSIGKAIAESNVPRNEIFLTTKVWNTNQGYHETMAAFETSLEKLRTDYLDLYLVHWPHASLTFETWKAMEELYRKGKIRAIGTSNFLIKHLNALINSVLIKPMVNQFEFHPELVQPELLAFCAKNHIQPQAWRPIMKGKVNEIPLLQELASKHRKSPVQVVLRWNIQKGVATIPKSVNPERIIHNADIFDFELTNDEMNRIDRLDRNARLGEDPALIDFA